MRLLQIDAFTDRPFGGNPAAVCLLDRERDAAWMQQVAAEMNLSETAFLLPASDTWSLRWFTPAVEVDLCGHATLASAHALLKEGRVASDELIRFQTRSGLLTARRDGDRIELDFPSTPPHEVEPPAGLLESLGIGSPLYVGRNDADYVVQVDSEAELRRLTPDFGRLGKLSTRGVIVTSLPASSEHDFVSRFFGPACGIDEDPVTGSAHCSLAPFWAPRLGRTDFVAHQASKRGGLLRVRLEGDRVKLSGQAVTVFRGELVV